MNQSIEIQIKECEARLEQAMLQSNVSVLDELLAPDLIFTNHLGQLMNKQHDLEAHQSKKLNIEKITLSNQKIKIYENIALVLVQADILGDFAGVTSANRFRFTRVWRQTSDKNWQVTVAHSSMMI